MFQYEWFDAASYEPIDTRAIRLRDVARRFGVRAVRASQWEEHCLECAPPDCYRECPVYARRMDGKCKRLDWGAVRAHVPASGFGAVDVRFRKWAKLETRLYPGVLSVGKAVQNDIAGERIAKGVSRFSRAIHGLSPHMRLNGALVVFRRKFLQSYRRAKNEETPFFLLHVYSPEEKPFGLYLEVLLDNKQLVHRERFVIEPGEGVHIAKLPEKAARPEGYGLLRLYPEEGVHPRLLIAFCDCVAMDEMPVAPERTPPPAQPAAKLKCVVWDLDNTLWDGTLIESEENALRLRGGVREAIEALDARGIVQSIASKNDCEPAMAQLKRLGVDDYFLYPQIGWGAKSASLKAIAGALNIDVNTFGFIDDSAFERAEVKQALPQVRIYEEDAITALLAAPEADVPVTKESQNRRAMYRTEAKRREAARAYTGGEQGDTAFLRGCELTLEVFAPREESAVARCVELIQRTNQLNLSGRRYARADFDALLLDPARDQYAMRCSDKFGEYGQSVFLQAYAQGGCAIVDEFAMSCRVAGKRVESAILRWLKARYGVDEVRFIGVKTAKNGLLIRSLLDAGMADYSLDERIDMRLEKGAEPVDADIVSVREVEA